jgi:hypothetical protein
MPRVAGCRNSSANGVRPIVPAPTRSCRSRLEPAGSDRADQRIEQRADPTRLGQVVASGVQMTGVQAEPQARMVFQCREVGRQIGDAGGQRGAPAGRGFDQDARGRRRQRVEQREQVFAQLD